MRNINKLAAAEREQVPSPPLLVDLPTCFLDSPEHAVREITLRMTFKTRDQLFKAVRRHGIVAGCDINVSSSGPPNTIVPAIVHSQRRLPNRHPAVHPCQALKEFPGAVIGEIITDH